MGSITPIEQLARLCAAAQGNYPMPLEVAAWLLAGVADFKSGRTSTLCRALGLRAPGQRSIKTLRANQRRDALLLRAFEHSRGADFHATDWARCVYLVSAMHKLDRIKGRAPQTEAEWEKGMYQALAEIRSSAAAGGPALPRSARQIYALVKRSVLKGTVPC